MSITQITLLDRLTDLYDVVFEDSRDRFDKQEVEDLITEARLYHE